jgi:hypothetical protein
MNNEEHRSYLNIETVRNGIQKLRTSKIKGLKDICPNKSSITSTELPQEGGIYVFWWIGDVEEFKKKSNRRLILSGRKKNQEQTKICIEITDEWLDILEDKICLYVGKTSSIQNRIGKHLQLSSERLYSLDEEIFNENAKTTSGQLRRGIEELFLGEENIRTLMLENIGLSHLILDGDQNAANRFYLEDRAIGEFFPIINIDVER